MVWALAQPSLKPAPRRMEDSDKEQLSRKCCKKKWNWSLPTPSPMGNLQRSETERRQHIKGSKIPFLSAKPVKLGNFSRKLKHTVSNKQLQNDPLRGAERSLASAMGAQRHQNYCRGKGRRPPKVSVLARGSGRWSPCHGESWQSHSNLTGASTQQRWLSGARLHVHTCHPDGKPTSSAFIAFTMHVQGCSRETIPN